MAIAVDHDLCHRPWDLCCGVLAGGIWLVGLKTLVGEYTCVNGIARQFISCSPPPSAEFFIGMLVVILPMAWRPEKGQVLSPVGLTPTIFLVGSVFIFHIQFSFCC